MIDDKVDGIDYCDCNNKITSVYGAPTNDVAWTPFLERKVLSTFYGQDLDRLFPLAMHKKAVC